MTVVKYFEDLESWDGERKSVRECETKMKQKETIRKGKSSKKSKKKEKKKITKKQHSTFPKNLRPYYSTTTSLLI
jgi:hypothetical protein